MPVGDGAKRVRTFISYLFSGAKIWAAKLGKLRKISIGHIIVLLKKCRLVEVREV
jgi:hypothetical protein